MHERDFNRDRRAPWMAAPSVPHDFRHHALLRDADATVFDALDRYLRLRLFDGPAPTQHGVRSASLCQGPSPRLARGLMVLGLVGLLIATLVGSELGRDLRQRSWDGDVMNVAVFILAPAARAPAAATSVIVFLSGFVLRRSARKHVWLVAWPCRDGAAFDLWIAGTSTHHHAQFEREFGAIAAAGRELVAPGPGLAPQPSPWFPARQA